MGIPASLTTFTSGATISSSQVNANFTSLYNVLNASVDDDNINASAGIKASKINFSTTPVALTGTTLTTTSSQVIFPTGSTGGGITSVTSNTLDEYEEGTWTPSLGGNATYTTQSGTYTKIGRMVFCTMSLHINNIGSVAANAAVTGLPFSSVAGRIGACSGYFTSSAVNIMYLTIYLPNGATFNIAGLSTAGTGIDAALAVWQSGTQMYLNFSYEAAS